MRRKVVINWGVSSFFGWGVYGLNLALGWTRDPDVELVAASAVDPRGITLDAVRLRELERFIQQSARLGAQLAPYKNGAAAMQTPLLAALNQDFSVGALTGVALTGSPTIGVTFFETAIHAPAAIANAAALPLIVTGSSWNERVLRAYGLTNVRTIIQGVDPLLFHLAPRPPARTDRFYVFSGGKLEARKGQDIALAAFRKFAERRPDAVLVAAWHSPWPQVARTVDATGVAAPVVFGANQKLDAPAWAAANGLRPEQFIDAGQVPNALMPPLLRQMDVGLFPNRCEGGTNLVAMECMACGTPAILSANSGHLDLIEDDNCFALSKQGEVTAVAGAGPYDDVPGWGESDVDEAVELLDRAYRDREAARRIGERGAATLAKLPWSRTAAEMKAAVLELAAG